MKRNVLVFISHYLPGQNVGGPLNSVRNVTLALRSEFNFFIVTSDRDLGSKKPYLNINKNKWLLVDDTPIMYMKSGFEYFLDVYNLLRKNSFDVIYINSFFDFRFSIYLILLSFLNLVKFNRVVIAPRGELMDNSLIFKNLKKEIYLRFIRFLCIYKKVIWHSTSEIETIGIEKRIKYPKILEAGVVVELSPSIKPIENIEFEFKDQKYLKVIFVSRISKDKNIVFALRVLKMVSCKVEFHIYGPIEDKYIWDECLEEMKKLPSNVVVKYRGIITKDLVRSFFRQYDLFFFPTHGENFGHVINESLSVGTPVLISDRTPWKSLESKGLGWAYSLQNMDPFIIKIEDHANLPEYEKLVLRNQVIKNYSRLINYEKIISENLNLFK